MSSCNNRVSHKFVCEWPCGEVNCILRLNLGEKIKQVFRENVGGERKERSLNNQGKESAACGSFP